MATPSKKSSDLYDDKKSYVVKDLIWKDHVSKIDVAQKFHDQRWGFLNDLQPQASAYDAKRSPRSLLAHAGTPVSSDRQRHEEQERQQQQQVTANPSPQPIPSTTNQFIGWRTADKSCTLEKYGKYARGQESLHKKFKWPVEGFD